MESFDSLMCQYEYLGVTLNHLYKINNKETDTKNVKKNFHLINGIYRMREEIRTAIMNY